MQLDRSNVRRMEVNGMILAMIAVYDLDSDQSFYEVSKTLAGKVLSISSNIDSLEAAEGIYKTLAKEMGASDKDIYNSKIK